MQLYSYQILPRCSSTCSDSLHLLGLRMYLLNIFPFPFSGASGTERTRKTRELWVASFKKGVKFSPFSSVPSSPFRLHRHDGFPQWSKTRAVAGNFSSRRRRETTIEYKLCCPCNDISLYLTRSIYFLSSIYTACIPWKPFGRHWSGLRLRRGSIAGPSLTVGVLPSVWQVDA